MPWRGPEVEDEFPTLGFLIADWIEANLVVPDGPFINEPFVLSDWQLSFLLHLYRLKVDATPQLRKPSRAFHYDRGGQLVMPQKTGKGPFSAAWAVAEAAGPVLFDGWDAKGEAVGRPWPTAWVEITAISEDQSGNVWRALLPMVREGPIAADIPDTGETRINLPGGGLIKPVTASAKSRLGGRVTAAVQDESHSWTRQNGGRKLADTQRRNLAGMGGRFLETSNAWDPTENSVAEATWEKGTNVYKKMVEPGPGSILNATDRERMLARVYAGSPWVDRERISSEIDEFVAQGDTAQAERFFLNRIVPGEDRAIEPKQWDACRVEPYEVPTTPVRSLITIGVDGARYIDALAVIATEVATGYQWPLGIWERPVNAPDTYEHPLDEVDGAVIEAFERWDVWRVYADPGSQTANISNLVEKWQGRWGEKRVIDWLMSRPKAAALMIRNYVAGIIAGDVKHPGDDIVRRHMLAARKKLVSAADEDGGKLWTITKEFPHSPKKIDAFAAGGLSWEARGDAIASGRGRPSAYDSQLCACPRRQPTPHIWRLGICDPR